MKTRILGTVGQSSLRTDLPVVSCLYLVRLFSPHFCLIVAIALMIGCSGSGGDTSSGGGGGQTGLPPDPGPAGMATLAGIDSNNNGVRDDVERYIALTYPADTDASARAALTQFTKAVQVSLLEAADPIASKVHANERIGALQCLLAKRPTDAETIFTALRDAILNTAARTKAYSTADDQLGGFTLPISSPEQWSSFCTTP